MIPEERREAVNRGLQAAFGTDSIGDIRRMTGGLSSNLVCRITVKGNPYLLRVIMRSDDASRHYANMRAAAAAGIAPRVWYSNTQDKVSITDFVNHVPLPITEAPEQMGSMLRTLHSLSPFEGVPNHINTSCLFLLHDGPARDGLVRSFQDSEVWPDSDRKEVFDAYQRIVDVYPLGTEMVSCHNDLKPENIMHDGHQPWLVDWEASFLNDRYTDLAFMASHIASNEEVQHRFLRAYFGRVVSASEFARFFVVLQLLHWFYAMAFLMLRWPGIPDVPPADQFDAEYSDLQARAWTRELSLGDPATRLAFGRAHWRELLKDLRSPQFEESFRILEGLKADGPPKARGEGG